MQGRYHYKRFGFRSYDVLLDNTILVLTFCLSTEIIYVYDVHYCFFVVDLGK